MNIQSLSELGRREKTDAQNASSITRKINFNLMLASMKLDALELCQARVE